MSEPKDMRALAANPSPATAMSLPSPKKIWNVIQNPR
jgi:hypothetical protein